jgi:hypothetical protein
MVVLLAGVELVARHRAEAQRTEARDEALHVLALDALSQDLHVAGRGCLAGVGHRSGADTLVHGLRWFNSRREKAGTDGSTRPLQPETGRVKARKVTTIPLGDSCTLSWLGRIDKERLPSGNSRVDVAAVAASLDVLTVVDDVDAAFDLTIDHLGHGGGQSLGQRCRVHPRVLQQLVEIIWPGQVATMRHQDFLSTSPHSPWPLDHAP